MGKNKSGLKLGLNNNKLSVAYLYLLPWLIGFLVFKLLPFGASLFYSFTDYDLSKSEQTTGFLSHIISILAGDSVTKFVGFDNYINIFKGTSYQTKGIMEAFGVTFQYAFLTVPLKLAFALFIAYILNFKLKGVKFFRTAYYIPSILGGSIAISVVWKFIWQNDGLINQVLKLLGMQPVNWLGEAPYAMIVISLLRVWQFGSAMVIFLAALKGIPVDLYEASGLDGASKTRQFFSITLPMISPVVFYNLITQTVQAFQEFNGPFIITEGKPGNTTTLVSLLIYNNAFKTYKMGIASAISWMLFIVVAVMTAISFASQKLWVYYGDEGK